MTDEKHKPKRGSARNLAKNITEKLNKQQPPILIKEVVEHLRTKGYHFSVYAWDFGNKTSGIQTTAGDTITIAYNKNHHKHRQRFTVAHEIGHVLLGHNNDENFFDLKSKDPNEIEANQFAAELLMPNDLLKTDIKNGIKDVPTLVQRYDVSEDALWWHLIDTGLFKEL